MKQKLNKLFEAYGRVGLVTYFVIYALTLVAIAIGISMGFEIKGAAGTGGLIAGTWAASRLTLPIRIGLTVLLTPVVHSAWKKFRPDAGQKTEAAPSQPPPPDRP